MSFDRLPSDRGVSSVAPLASHQSASVSKSVQKQIGRASKGSASLQNKVMTKSLYPLSKASEKEPLLPVEVKSAKNNGNTEKSTKGSTATNNRWLIKSKRALSAANFDKLGVGYELPVADHKYEIRYGLKFGEFGVKPPARGYMTAVIKRAKSCVDPRKYAS